MKLLEGSQKKEESSELKTKEFEKKPPTHNDTNKKNCSVQNKLAK